MNTDTTDKDSAMTTKTTENGHGRSHSTHSSTQTTKAHKGNKVAGMANDAIDTAKDEVSDLADRGHKVIEEGETLLSRVEDTLRENPYMAVGVGVGAGLLVGTIFGSKLGRMAILLAGGYVASEFIKRGGIDFDSLTGAGASNEDDEDDEPNDRVRLDDDAKAT